MHFFDGQTLHAVFLVEDLQNTPFAALGRRGAVGDSFWQNTVRDKCRLGGGDGVDGEAYAHFAGHQAIEVVSHVHPAALSSAGAFRVTRLRPDAEVPVRAHASDAGFDIVVTHLTGTVGKVGFYGTGLSVRPPLGFWFALFPRSSLSKTGYMLANGVGVIDPSYSGEVVVALRKVDPDAPDLELPAKVAQIVPLSWFHMSVVVGDPEVGDASNDAFRDQGGFGSSDDA